MYAEIGSVKTAKNGSFRTNPIVNSLPSFSSFLFPPWPGFETLGFYKKKKFEYDTNWTLNV